MRELSLQDNYRWLPGRVRRTMLVVLIRRARLPEQRSGAVRLLGDSSRFGQDKLDPLEDFLTVCPARQWLVSSNQVEDFVIDRLDGPGRMAGDGRRLFNW